MREAAYYVSSCVVEGGPFTTLSVLLALGAAAAMLVWFARQIIRGTGRREDLRRIHDLLVEGSLGEAILFADKRSHDPVMRVVHVAVTAIQSSKSRKEATERLESEISIGFPKRRMRTLGMLGLLVLALLPAAMGIVGTQWAHFEVAKAAEAMEAISPTDVETVWADGKASLIYECPQRLGVPVSFGLLIPMILLMVSSLRYWRSRKRARNWGQRFIEMGAIVLDPQYRVYAREQGTYTPTVQPWDDQVPRGGGS